MLAVTSGAITIAAHGLGGGDLSEFIQVVPLVVLIAGAAASLADRRSGKLSVIAALGVSQFAQHLLLSWADHAHGASISGQMFGAHVVAAILIGILLFHAESALFALVAAVYRLLPSPVTPLPSVAPLRVSVPAVLVPTHSMLVRRVHGRRGPPCLLI
ncbi:hypothetical protein Lesp02_48290 [Lentzea sp. NBRC 105346]|nr:hypothetical protein Lesp02_48290 [Lentzea sp. NBRC 105346]